MAFRSVKSFLTPKNRIGRLAKLNGAMAAGFVGLDTYMNMQEGDSMPVAAGKALLTNAIWMAVPGGFFTAAAFGVAMATPQILDAVHQGRRNLSRKAQIFGKGFQENEGQQLMKYFSMQSMQNARQHAAAIMAGHARTATRYY